MFYPELPGRIQAAILQYIGKPHPSITWLKIALLILVIYYKVCRTRPQATEPHGA